MCSHLGTPVPAGNVREKPRRTEPLNDKLLLTVPDVATALSISVRMTWRLVSAGKLRTVRLGRAVRIPVEEVERLVAGDGEP